MKTNNLEIALREFRILVEVNDKKINITYNDYKIDEILEYKQYLLGLYNAYFVDLRAKFENLLLNNNTNTLLKLVQSRIDLFNDIKDTKGIHNNRWRFYLTAKRKSNRDPNIKSFEPLSNAFIPTLEKIMRVQLIYVQKAIKELTSLYNIYSPNLQNEQIAAPTLKRIINADKLKDYFVSTFKGMGNGNINNFDLMIEELKADFTGKEFAQIALMIYESGQMNKRKPNTFAEWYKLFCGLIGCEQKSYDPNKLRNPKERIIKLFNYLQ